MDRMIEANEIIKAITEGNFILKDHARDQATARSISLAQVQNIAKTVTEVKWQESKGTYRILGMLDDEKGGGLAAKREPSGVWVVTVFKRRLKKKKRKG